VPGAAAHRSFSFTQLAECVRSKRMPGGVAGGLGVLLGYRRGGDTMPVLNPADKATPLRWEPTDELLVMRSSSEKSQPFRDILRQPAPTRPR